jgi:hypothetical protein
MARTALNDRFCPSARSDLKHKPHGLSVLSTADGRALIRTNMKRRTSSYPVHRHQLWCRKMARRGTLESAPRVVSIVTASEPNGLLARFAGGEIFTFYIPREFAAEVITWLSFIGKTARWWDESFRLLPKPN